MFRNKLLFPVCLALAVVFCCVKAHAQNPAGEMTKSAAAWLDASGNLKTKALMDFTSPERENWHFVPRTRKGVSLAEMNGHQRELLHNLLRTALSQRGFLQATTIVSLEVVLREIENSDIRDSGRYFLTIFGQPTARATWGWRFEGHHLSLNFLVVGGKQVTVAPSFFGSNPAGSRSEGKEVRPLALEEDLARGLVKSLNADQRKIAVFSDTAPRDIVTGVRRQVQPLKPEGIAYSALQPDQQRQLRELLETYVNRYRQELAREDLDRISKAGWARVTFAWAGGLEKGQGHYYRVQGPTFLLEYDNTQNRANHIHTVWRDLERDFGGDLLKEHYNSSDHHAH